MSQTTHWPGSPGMLAAWACQLEATIPKPGNVHRGADFDDMSLYDLLASGVILGATIDRCAGRALGATILDAVRNTRALVGKNTNLGLILLLAPLAQVLQTNQPLSRAAIGNLFDDLTEQDSHDIYQAIRTAAPGGLGRSSKYDIADEPPADIRRAMQIAAPRDAVAHQWTETFADVLDWFVPQLANQCQAWNNLERAVIAVHVEWIARHGDSLIERKCGTDVNRTAQRMAAEATQELDRGWEAFEQAVGKLDFWMRSDGHRRNPGTTADLIAAGLFVGMATGALPISSVSTQSGCRIMRTGAER